ncbi:DUF4190 domain-containing protein [Catelliglobosispora koreensis]|uniref:DUF4190 domain-containing protein n=1 Tax=Catelliglobosispora koreensis TaxID=129052 RepID=UPI000363A44A|nr:DUF4190 domain-containing protein [Catelliglobosispora koreensis]
MTYVMPDGQNPERRTNAFAVVSLVLGLVGGVGLSAIFGYIALGQIKRSGEKGKKLAIAGIVLSVAWVVGYCAFASKMTDLANGSAPGFGYESVRAGECFNWAGNKDFANAEKVPCGESHDVEVFGLVNLEKDGSEIQQQSQAFERCQQLFKLDAKSESQSEPTLAVNFDLGNRNSKRVLCVVERPGGKLTGSVLK